MAFSGAVFEGETTDFTRTQFLQPAYFARMLFDWTQLKGRLAAADSTHAGSTEAAYGVVRRHLKNLSRAEDARAAYREGMEQRRLALLFKGLSSSFLPAQSSPSSEPEKLDGFLPSLYLSLCIFTRLSLPWHPEGHTRLWVAVEAVLGWLFLAGFIAICARLLSS